MSQQLHEMLKLFSEMESSEQQELIREIRNRKHTEKPAVQKHKRKAAQPSKKKAEALLSSLSAEQLQELLKGHTE